jgi:hypothetical protein
VCADHVESVDIGEISSLSVEVYFVSADRIIQSPSVIVSQVVAESYVSLSFIGELDNDHYNIPSAVEEKHGLGRLLEMPEFISDLCRTNFL